jgi:pimeloyl-ACP methyl ester carboxylesterase
MLKKFMKTLAYLDELTEMLNIPKFFLMAHSCGTSYALAAYPTLKHKIIGAIRVLGLWAPTNLPCMPSSYAFARSLPTSMVRGMLSLSSMTNSMPLGFNNWNHWQMGCIGEREEDQSVLTMEALARMGQENSSSDYKACEADWLLSMEITRPMNINYKSIDVAVRCWHGMDDNVVPLGTAMWMQREMKRFLLFAVEGATHNILLDMGIMRAVFSDIVKEATEVRIKAFSSSNEVVEEPLADVPLDDD